MLQNYHIQILIFIIGSAFYLQALVFIWSHMYLLWTKYIYILEFFVLYLEGMLHAQLL
jgi:hypothetical protein